MQPRGALAPCRCARKIGPPNEYLLILLALLLCSSLLPPLSPSSVFFDIKGFDDTIIYLAITSKLRESGDPSRCYIVVQLHDVTYAIRGGDINFPGWDRISYY